jgi:hypothetical protein
MVSPASRHRRAASRVAKGRRWRRRDRRSCSCTPRNGSSGQSPPVRRTVASHEPNPFATRPGVLASTVAQIGEGS